MPGTCQDRQTDRQTDRNSHAHSVGEPSTPGSASTLSSASSKTEDTSDLADQKSAPESEQLGDVEPEEVQTPRDLAHHTTQQTLNPK
jgi:hypothetical protein